VPIALEPPPSCASGATFARHRVADHARSTTLEVALKRLLAVLCLGVVAMSLAGCTPLLLHNQLIPEFKPAADQALCVVIRPVAMMGNVFIPIYLDTEYVGGTEGNTILSFPVTPGEHMVIADATNESKVRFDFKPGKTYYIAQTVVSIDAFVVINTSTFTVKNASDALAIINNERGKSTWVQPNPARLQENLSAAKLAEAKRDWAEWAAKPENAQSAREEKEYPGY
jgi:hypothetical protein